MKLLYSVVLNKLTNDKKSYCKIKGYKKKLQTDNFKNMFDANFLNRNDRFD